MSSYEDKMEAELNVLETVELKVAVSLDDKKFQHNINIFLAPVILKLASNYPDVRVKALKFLSHLLLRFNSSRETTLPISKLLTQAIHPVGFPDINNFHTCLESQINEFSQVKLYTYVFISKGLERKYSDDEILLFIIGIIDCIENELHIIKITNSKNNQFLSRAFHIFLKLIEKLNLKYYRSLGLYPFKSDAFTFNNLQDFTENILHLNDKQDALNFILTYLVKVDLLLPKPQSHTGENRQFYFCPGLTNEEVKFLTYTAGASFSYQFLNNLKRKMLLFLSLIDFDSISQKSIVYPKYFLLLLFAKVDADSNINSIAENLLKKVSLYDSMDTDNDLVNDIEFLKKALDYFLGSTTKKPVPCTVQDILLKSVFLKSKKFADDMKTFGSLLLDVVKIGFGTSSSGLDNNNLNLKLKLSTVLFVKHIATFKNNGTWEQRRLVFDLANFIYGSIHNDGWPKSSLVLGNGVSMQTSILQNIRCLEYEALSDLIASTPEQFFDFRHRWDSGFMFLKFFFNSLVDEDSDNISVIKDSLSKLINPFARYHNDFKKTATSESSLRQLKNFFRNFLAKDNELLGTDGDIIISGGVSNSISSCRCLALKFINSSFAYNDPEARFLNIYGSFRGNRYDVLEASEKGLNPYLFNINKSSIEVFSGDAKFINKTTKELMGFESKNKIIFPKFSDLISQLKVEFEFLSKYQNTCLLIETLKTSFEYIFKVLVMESLEDNNCMIPIDSDWDFRVLNSLTLDLKVRESVSKYFLKIQSESAFMFFLNKLSDCYLSLNNLISNQSYATVGSEYDTLSETELQKFNKYYSNIERYGSIFVSIISLSSPHILRSTFTDEKLTALMTLINYGITDVNSKSYNKSFYNRLIHEETIYIVSKSSGIIFSTQGGKRIAEDLCKVITDELVELIITNNIGFNHLDFVTSRFNIIANIIGRMAIFDDFVDLTTVIANYNKLLKFCYDTKNWKHFNILLSGINELCKYGSLKEQTSTESLTNIKDIIITKLKKFDEKSVLSLAYLSLVCEHDDYIDVVYNTHTSKQIEFLFASGEALCIIACGWKASNLYNNVDVQNITFEKLSGLSKKNKLEPLLSMLVKGAANSKPSLRKACCIWLLSIVQYCGHLNEVFSKSREIQVAFMRFLSDSDDIIQESASTGLSLIYESSNDDLKEDLVKGLMKSFTNSANAMKLSSGNIEEDTELFEPGILNTKDGSISTYKDILNLATDVGDPSLVYKFMSLTKNSSLWSSRRGIAFGLSNIMSKSILEKRLSNNDELTKKLIVKLYRYKFDPNENVSRSMNDIWNILVPNGSKVVEINSDLILHELLTSIGSREWRTRQATTMAMIDLLQIMPMEKYENSLEQIWSLSFRALDDIKESVRESANHLTKFLANSLLRSIESNKDNKKFSGLLNKLIPFLVSDKGILSSVDEVRSFSLNIILKLSDKAGDVLKPFIPSLVEELLVLMSNLEPQIVNYIALNADKYNLKLSDIDAQRLSSVRQSPLMEAIEKMIDLITDDELIAQLVSKINNAIRRSVGLPSKVMASRVIVTLVLRNIHILNEKFAESLLQSCINQLNDRNETVCMAFANSAGYICRIAKLDTVLKYGELLKRRYFEFKVEEDRKISAVALESISKHASDTFMKLHSFFLSFAFVCSNDLEKDIGDIFKGVWIEHTGSQSNVKMYIDEICQIVSKNLQSQQYSIRQVSAKAIAIACNMMSNSKLSNEKSINGLSESTVTNIFNVLLESSKGRLWVGKESIVAALVTFSGNFVDQIKANEELYNSIENVILTEVKKRNKQYRKDIICSLGDFVHSFPSEHLTDEEIVVVRHFFNDSYFKEDDNDSETDSDSESDDSNKKIKSDKQYSQSSQVNIDRENTNIAVIKALTKSINVDSDFSLKLTNFFFNEVIPKLFLSQHFTSTWRTKAAICDSCNIIFQSIQKYNEAHTDKIIFEPVSTDNLFEVIKSKCLYDIEIENIRLHGARAIGNMSKVVSDDAMQHIQNELLTALKYESSDVVKVEIKKYL